MESMFYWSIIVRLYISLKNIGKHAQSKPNCLKSFLAEIETTHRAAKGDAVCKFLIKESKEGYL